MRLYLILNIITIVFPLLLSWDKKVRFYKQFRALLPAILIVGAGFIIWDVYYTYLGVWGFNEEHLMGLNFFGLPVEEFLFFFTVPYACVFLNDTINVYWPVKSANRWAIYLNAFWIIFSLILFFTHLTKYYTAVACGLSAITGAFVFLKDNLSITALWRSFLFVLIPFLIINGALTGLFTDTPVVWYNDEENSTYRLLTIPVEDLFYNFSLIVGIIMLRDYFLINLNKK